MKPVKRQFRRETKLEATRRVEQGASIRTVAKELKIPQVLLQEWIAKGVSVPWRPVRQ